MNFRIILFTAAILLMLLPFTSAAHFIVGFVNNATDGTDANSRTIVVWNPDNGINDNVTDTVGELGNSNQNNTYMVDCELLNNPCSINDIISAKIFNDGDNYFTTIVNLTVTGAGFDVMEDLDLNTPPNVSLTSPIDGMNISSIDLNFSCSASDIDGNLANMTLYGNWTGDWHANQTNNVSGFSNDTNFSITFPNTVGTFEWSCYVTDDTPMSIYAPSNFTFNIDNVPPEIDFGIGTRANGTFFEYPNIYVNISLFEHNFGNITFDLHNETGLVNRTTFITETREINWTGLNDNIVTYFYNVTAVDSFGNVNYTNTRTLTLTPGDIQPPLITIISPPEDGTNYSTSIILFNVTLDEEGDTCLYSFNEGISNNSMTTVDDFVFNATNTTVPDGDLTAYFYCNDTEGNVGNENRTFTVDTIAPNISYGIGTLKDGGNFSRSNIYVNVSVIELHESNITFTLHNSTDQVNSTTFYTQVRSINWTDLPDENYTYNVTVYDSFSNHNTSQTRYIILDTTPPNSTLISPADDLLSPLLTHNLTFNATDDRALDNATVLVYNITDDLINETSINISGQFNESGIVITFPYDGNFSWAYIIRDNANNPYATNNRTLALDANGPTIFFEPGTEANNTEIEHDFVYINISIPDGDLANITYWLFNDTNGLTLVNMTTYNLTTNVTSIFEINMTGLPSSNITYFYNVSAKDDFNNENVTETRTLHLVDLTPPLLTLNDPQNITYNINTSIPLTYDLHELNPQTCWYNVDDGPNITLPNCQESSIDVADEQSHTLRLYVNDTFGFMNQSEVTFFVNTSLIFTPDWLVQRGVVSVNGAQEVGLEESVDSSRSFVRLTARSGDASPDVQQVTGVFVNSSTIRLENFAGGAAFVEWEVITGPNLTTQRQEDSYLAADVAFNATLTSDVNLSESFILVYNRLDSSTNGDNDVGFWTGRFLNSTLIEFERGVTGVAGTLAWQVVEWEGARVLNGSVAPFATQTTTDTLTSNVDTSMSFLVFSNRVSGGGLDDTRIGGYLINESTVRFYRRASGGTFATEWFVVESDLLRVERGENLNLAGGTAVVQNINQLINTNRSFNQPYSDSSGGGTNFANSFFTTNITNSTELIFQKGTANQNQNVSWQVIEIIEQRPPTVNLVYPVDFSNISTNVVSQFNYSVNDTSVILNCSLFGNWTDTWHLNQSEPNPVNNFSVIQNFSSVDLIEDGRYVWNVECWDAYGNLGYNSTNFTILSDTTPPNITNVSVNSTNMCDFVRVNCTLNDELIGVGDVFIEVNAPTMNINITALNITENVWVADIPLNVSGIFNLTCHAGDLLYNNASLNATNNVTVNETDLTLTSDDIVFSTINPIENDPLIINATIHNLGCIPANNALVSFFNGDPDPETNGTQINGNQTLTLGSRSNTTVNVSWTTEIGTHNFFVLVDINDSIAESNETNNEANLTLNTTAWQILYGNATVDKLLADNNISNITFWLNESSLVGNIFITDTESDIDWSSLQAIGKSTTDLDTPNDFSEIDTMFNMTTYEDSVANIFTSDGNTPLDEGELLIHQILVDEVPLVNTTNSYSFVTGILWDTTDDVGDGEFSQDDQEDLVFASPLNKSRQGSFGVYDYEIRIPVRLREYDPTDSSDVYIYFDLN